MGNEGSGKRQNFPSFIFNEILCVVSVFPFSVVVVVVLYQIVLIECKLASSSFYERNLNDEKSCALWREMKSRLSISFGRFIKTIE
jgi:hypothetical protein